MNNENINDDIKNRRFRGDDDTGVYDMPARVTDSFVAEMKSCDSTGIA
jgi:hypothetical protein